MKIRRFIGLRTGWQEQQSFQAPDMSGTGPFLWTHATDVRRTDVGELAQLTGIDAGLIEYCLDTDASFITGEMDALFELATRTVRMEGNQLRFASLLISLDTQGLVTAESNDSSIGAAVRELRGGLEAGSAWKLLAALLDQVAESYLVMEAVEDQALAMERHLGDAPLVPAQLSALFRMRRQLIVLKRVIAPVAAAVSRLARAGRLRAATGASDFRATDDAYRRLESRIEGTWQLATSVVEMSNLLEQQRQGSANRKLAAWAAIVAVPTAVASIFGMNFDYMPGMDSKHGPWMAIAAMGAGSLVLYYRFRKTGWL